MQLRHTEDVGRIFLIDNTAALDLADSLAISRADQAQASPLGYTGSGVNVAVYEAGPSDTTQLIYEDRYLSAPEASDHARLTSAIIKNNQTTGPKGYASNCSLFSANSRNVAAVDWAARTKCCTVISQSFHQVAGLDPFDEQTVSTLSFDDVLKDWLDIQWPYPTIVHAAGNDRPGDLEYVNHKGFNTISVGSHTNDAKTMNDFSVFKNPIPPHMDRELPEITANGDSVTAVGETMSGTSFAAPAVAETVALIQEADPVLKSWPEGCRAVLFASADRNIKSGTWWSDVSNNVDAWDGAGALNAEGACQIAKSRQHPGLPPSQFGWDVTTLTNDSFGPDTLSTSRWRWKVIVPSPPLLLRVFRVKVALAFNSTIFPNPAIPVWGGTTETSDLNINLDLIVRNSAGTQVANFSSFDNSYEIVEFNGRRGETYEIIIRRNEGTRNVFAGIAWGVWGRLNVLNPVPLPGTTLLPGSPRPRPRPPFKVSPVV